MQDGFIKVFKKIENYSFEGSFEGWMRRIIVNTAIDTYRKRKRELTLNESIFNEKNNSYVIEDDFNPYEGLSIKDIVGAMQELSPAYINVFNL